MFIYIQSATALARPPRFLASEAQMHEDERMGRYKLGHQKHPIAPRTSLSRGGYRTGIAAAHPNVCTESVRDSALQAISNG